MKKIIKYSLLFTLLLSGCSTHSSKPIIDEKLLIDDVPRETYSNSFSKEFIPNYWESYGTGDPFVFRYDGMYYLYVSSKNTAYSVMGWKSEDLIHWEQCDNGVNPKGLVGEDDCLWTAFAPEVCYFNGWFYMCESRRGTGHYILASRSPEGPFEPITDNIAQEIDGSFYIDDNEKIYFLRASRAGIRINEMDETDGMKIVGAKQLEDTQIGGWTEGPHMFKKDGIYYLTYTGTAVTSPAYRVAYSYHTQEEAGDFFDPSGYTYGNLLLLDTSEEFNGLGHSCNVMGPNLDSMYIVYHNLVSLNGPYRHYNLSRLMFNGTEMSVNHPKLNNNLVPQSPEFYSKDDTNFEEIGNYLLSNKSSTSRFTVELNMKGNDKGIISYIDNSNYTYVQMTSSNILNLVTLKDGVQKTLNSVKMNKSYDYDVNHTYRIAHDQGHISVSFDGMEKMNFYSDVLKGGKVGYEKGCSYSSTTFSNDAFDSSQRNDYKQDSALALTYEEEISSINKDNITTLYRDMGLNGYDGGAAIKLSRKKDFATYKTYFFEEGIYGLDVTVPTKYMGERIAYRINNGPVFSSKIGKIPTDENIVKFHIGNFEVKKGVNYISIYNDGDEIEFTKLDWYKTSTVKKTFEHDLSSYIDTGAYYVNSWKIKQGGHYALSGNRQLMYIGDDTMRDYSVEVDVILDGETNASTAGIVLRASNPSFAAVDDVNSIVGYHCGFNLTKVFITESNYNQTIIGESNAIECDPNVSYRLKAECVGNEIKFYINGELQLTYYTTLGPTHGKIALYTNGAAAVYKNLKIKTL